MNNDEEFVRQWHEVINSLANSEAHSGFREREEDRENVGQKRPAESRREQKMNRVKRQCVTKSSHKSHRNLSEKKKQRDIIRSKIETLQQITPNCPKDDIISILDSAIEYTKSLHLAVFLTVLQHSI